MKTDLDQLIDNLAVELSALDAAEEYSYIYEDEGIVRGSVRDARARVHEAQEKIHAAAMSLAWLKVAARDAAKPGAEEKPATEGDEITPEALVKLGFRALNGRWMTFRRGIERNGVEVHFDWDDKFDYAMAHDPEDDELVIAAGVRTVADIRELYRLLTGETLAEVK